MSHPESLQDNKSEMDFTVALNTVNCEDVEGVQCQYLEAEAERREDGESLSQF